jgi:hypothetical protein
MVLSDLMPNTLGRIEENLPTAPVFPGPTFWSLAGEVYPQMVDAEFEAALITGVVQIINVVIDLSPTTTYFFGMPKGALAPIRMKGPYPIRKASLKGLDDMLPNWQSDPRGSQVLCWFPLGVSGFGIYPQLTADVQVVMDFIASPVNQARPYTGAETVPFQSEFTDFLPQYAATMLRAKEGGAEAEEANVVYEEYLSNMKALSLFQGRLDSLVMTGAYGGRVQTNSRVMA